MKVEEKDQRVSEFLFLLILNDNKKSQSGSLLGGVDLKSEKSCQINDF